MAITYTKTTVKPKGESYEIVANGYIPALVVNDSDKDGKMLFVITGAKEFSFVSKSIRWDILYFNYNLITQDWDFITKEIISNNEMWVNTTTPVDATGKVTTPELKVMSEADFYIESLGKQIIYPAILNALEVRIKTIISNHL